MSDDELRLAELRHLQARSLALEMVLRGVLTHWAMSTQTIPDRFVFAAIENLVASMDEIGGPVTGL